MKVALIDLPFYHAHSCSSGLALLKAYLIEAEIPSKCFYFNLEFAAKIGFHLYAEMEEHDSMFDSNWVFMKKIFDAQNSIEYLSKSRQNLKALYELQRQACDYIDELADRDWEEYQIIGLSTFPHQLNAALALGKLIKEKHPEKIIVYGGVSVANSFGVEYIKCCPWIDAVFLGEADYVFAQFCKKIQKGCVIEAAALGLKGIAYRSQGQVSFVYDDYTTNMNDVAVPNYDDFVKSIEPYKDCDYFKNKRFTIGFEISRGCQYGIKKCCTFCSFVRSTGSKYNMRSVENALYVLEQMYVKYSKDFDFDLCDVLFPRHGPEKIFRPWAKRRKELDINPHARLWIEAKPWHPKEDIRLMKEVQVDFMHFGIEHLQSDALKSMRKGQTTIQCLSTLKWSEFYKMASSWTLLLQIPGEEMRWYDELVALIPKIIHLHPPDVVLNINILKESPYFYEHFGFSNLRPMWEYDYIMPPGIDKEKAAYYYAYDGWNENDKYKYVTDAISKWRDLYFECEAELKFDENLSIIDSRSGKDVVINISLLEKEMLTICDEAKQRRHFRHDSNWGHTIQGLIDKNLILSVESRFLSLVL